MLPFCLLSQSSQRKLGDCQRSVTHFVIELMGLLLARIREWAMFCGDSFAFELAGVAEKTCPHCGAELQDSSRFCPGCGTPLAETPAARAVPGRGAHTRRDTAIIVSVFIAVAVGFFTFRTPQTPHWDHVAGSSVHAGVEDMARTMEALGRLPVDYDSLVEFGNRTMDQADYALAAECYRRALSIREGSPDMRTDYGACLHAMGLPHRAIEEFKRVLAEHPRHGIACFNLGVVYYSEQLFDSARTYWVRYLVLEPGGNAAEQARRYLKELDG